MLEKCTRGEYLSIEEIVELINGTLDRTNKRLIKDYSANYTRSHRQEILLLPPLYLSSICENNCLYCDFTFFGARLSYDEFLDEFNQLLDMGYQSIELVSSQDPELFFHRDRFDLNYQLYDIDRVVKYFELGKKRLEENGGGMLTSNIPPVDVKSLKKLKSVGLDCYLIWLETFDPPQYVKLHKQEGPKANQAFRLDSFENAIDAGIEHVAGAFLKGLSDWRKDEAALYLLDKYLKKKTGRGFSIVGTPRLKGLFTKSEFVKPYLVSDEDYELNFALDRILFDGILWLQTRESPSFNFRLIERYGAGVILTLDCSTAPGGYNKPPKSKPQFPVYRQDLSKAISRLKNNGYRVNLAWDGKTLFNMQRNIGK